MTITDGRFVWSDKDVIVNRKIKKSENPYCMICSNHGDQPFHETNEHWMVSKSRNPLWDGDGVQLPGQPRGKGGRWTDTGQSALSAVRSAMDLGEAGARQHTGSRPSRAGASGGAVVTGAKKTAFKNGVLQEKLKRLPRSGNHVMEDKKGNPLQSKKLTPEEAITRRNVGSTAIDNKRLKQIWEDWNKSKKMPNKTEYDLIVSAGGQNHIDGDSETIKTSLKSGAATNKSRAQMFTMLRSQWAAGSGDRSFKREGISTESRDKAAAKRRASKKFNSASQAQKRDMLADIFSVNGKTSTCIFCGKEVNNNAMSLETMQPKSKGGTYTIGDMVPAHRTCNERGNKRAQSNPGLYYQDQKRNYQRLYSAAIRKKHRAAGAAE